MYVFVILRNADMTEGRGPMVVHSVFLDRDEAIAFASKQEGIMGRSAPNPDWEVIRCTTGHNPIIKRIFPIWKQITPTRGQYIAID